MQQLNIDGIGDAGVKIYDTGGLKFKVKDSDLVQEIRSAKKVNKDKLRNEVKEKVKELEGSFARQADLIQKAVEQETENAYGDGLPRENVMKLDTANFIRTIQEHMDEYQEATIYPKPTDQGPASGLQLQQQASAASLSIPDAGDEANRSLRDSPLKASEQRLTLLPEITGPVKSIKQLLLQDLEADGVIRRNIPFSTRRK